MAYSTHTITLSHVEDIIDIIGIIGIKRIIVVKYYKGSNMHNVHNQFNVHKWYNMYNSIILIIDIFVFRVWHIHVPYHHWVPHAHRNHFCLRARRGDRGFQIDDRETRTETSQTCLAEQREFHTCPTCQHFRAGFCGNQEHRIPHAGPRRPPTCARCDDVPSMHGHNKYNANNSYNINKCHNQEYENITFARSQIFNSIPLHGPSSSPAISDSIPLLQKRSGANASPLSSVQLSRIIVRNNCQI